MYPLSILFYILPLTAAYGWFAALHLFLAGAFTYLARTLRIEPLGRGIGGGYFRVLGIHGDSYVFRHDRGCDGVAAV